MTDVERRQGGTDTAEVLPEWLSYSAYTAPNGQREYTIVNLPQTYYGPSIPLGTDGAYVFGGFSSPPPELPASVVPTTSAAAESSVGFAAPTSTADVAASTVASSALDPSVTMPASGDPPTPTGPLGTVSFLSTLSGASVRSTSLAVELTSAVSDLSVASLASQSIDSIFSQATSARSAFSTASDASTISTASVRSASALSTHSVAVASAESSRSTASARSSESTASIASTSSVFVASISSIAAASGSSASVASTASSSSWPSTSPSPQSASSHLPIRSIIALAIGLFIAALLIALLLLFCYRWRERRRQGAVVRRIPPERSNPVRRSFFTGENAPPDGRITVQGTVFDLWTPEQRAMRERQQQRAAGASVVTDWARRSMAFLTGSQSSRGSGASRRVSRTQQNANAEETIGEETPLVGDQSPPLSPPPNSPPPFSNTWGPIPGHPDSPLPPVSLPFANLPGSSSSADASPTHSRNQSGMSLDQLDSNGDGEHETAQLLIARRATRGPAPRLGRLSWFRRMGILGGETSDEGGTGQVEEDEKPISPTQIAGPSELPDPRRLTASTHQTGPSINTLLEMGYVADAFPNPPGTAARGPVGRGLAVMSQRPVSTVSTQSVYHDAQSTLSPSRPTTPVTMIPVPEPTTPPPRRRPVPPFLPHARPSSVTFLGSRTDLLDSPVPSPLRRSYHAAMGSSEGRSAPTLVPPPELDIADDLPPPLPAWHGSRSSAETAIAESLSTDHSVGAEEQEERRSQPNLRRFTFGYPLLVDEPQSRPMSYDGQQEPVVSSPEFAEPSSLSSLRSHFSRFGFMPPRSVEGHDFDSSVMGGTSLDVPVASTSTSTPRSSVAFTGQDDLSFLDTMPTSAFGKPKAPTGWPMEHDP